VDIPDGFGFRLAEIAGAETRGIGEIGIGDRSCHGSLAQVTRTVSRFAA
jgi:hypothetical protein